MKIKIIDNPKSYLRARVTCGESPASDEYATALEGVAGEWIDVDTKHLFETSFNGIIGGKVYHVPVSLVTEIQDDARVGYPWIHVGRNGLSCYTESAIQQLVRDRLLTEVKVEFYSFASKRRHTCRLAVQNNFSFGEVQLGVNNWDTRNNEYSEGTVSPSIDSIHINS